MTLADACRGRENHLDLIRSLAAIAVIYSHSYPIAGSKWEPGYWLVWTDSLGAIAVYIFFAISGFLIAKSWNEDPRPAPFFVRRAARILPGLACVVLLTALVLGPMVTTLAARDYFASPELWKSIRRDLTLFNMNLTLPGVFRSNPLPATVNGSLWTLPIEAYLYAAVPLLWLAGRRLSRATCAGLLFALIAVGLAWNWHGFATPGAGLRRILHLSFPSTLHAALFFMAGSLLYLLRDRIVLRPAYGLAAAVLLAAAARTPHFYLIALATLPYIIFCLGFARAPRLAGFRRGGDPSYGLYVYAFPVQQTIAHAAPGIAPLALFSLALPIVAALAYLSWFLVERPCLRFGRKLFAKPAPTPQVAPRRAA